MIQKIESASDRLRKILNQSVPTTKDVALGMLVAHNNEQSVPLATPVYHPVGFVGENSAPRVANVHISSERKSNPLDYLPRRNSALITEDSLKPSTVLLKGEVPSVEPTSVAGSLFREIAELFKRHEAPSPAITLVGLGISREDKKTLGILQSFNYAVGEGTHVLKTGVLATMVEGVVQAIADARSLRSEVSPQSTGRSRNIRLGDSFELVDEFEAREHDPRLPYPSTFSVAASLDDHGGHITSTGDGFSTTEVSGSGISMSIGASSSRKK